jgi:hypothetical protein
MLRRVLRFVVAVLLVGSGLCTGPGCKQSGDSARPTSSGAPELEEPSARKPSPFPTVMAAGDAASVTVDATLPPDFPKEVPIYEGARLLFASKSSSPQGRAAWTVTLETGDAKERVVEFYKSHLKGFRLATSMDLGDTSMSVWQGATYDATLMATMGADAKTTATLTVGGK